MKNTLLLFLLLSIHCQSQEFLQFASGDDCAEVITAVEAMGLDREAEYHYVGEPEQGYTTVSISCDQDNILSNLSVSVALEANIDGSEALTRWRDIAETIFGAPNHEGPYQEGKVDGEMVMWNFSKNGVASLSLSSANEVTVLMWMMWGAKRKVW